MGNFKIGHCGNNSMLQFILNNRERVTYAHVLPHTGAINHQANAICITPQMDM